MEIHTVLETTCTMMMGTATAAFLQPAGGTTEQQRICKRCGGQGCDIRLLDCGCTLHARCTPLIEGSIPITTCPCCGQSARRMHLIAMSFDELDEARRVAASTSVVVNKRGQKRKSATIARLNPQASNSTVDESGGDDLRTGRWTTEEMAYCDVLVDKFESGQLPLVDGTKLNDFLSGMLKSKQSRLTKKMKNAKLSAKTFTKKTGYIEDDARWFSQVESDFFASIPCSMERAEIRFHMQKEWRELFSNYCVQVGQPLDVDEWLSSVEELERRMSEAKDQARMQRRKLMMGYALSQDSMNPDQGVFIEHSSTETLTNADEITKIFEHAEQQRSQGMARRLQSAPFLQKTIAYMERYGVPFEHVDAWVPSFVPVQDDAESKCRLCFAGCATTNIQLHAGNPLEMASEDRFDWLAFGEYSQKFSFDVGCGLPGRVYQHGVPSWEQNVENAPHHHFERCGGASQWGIKTVVAIPIPSPSVGRIVVLLYSQSDRSQDQDMVTRMTAELTKLVPSPKWKLVVDVGTPTLKTNGSSLTSPDTQRQDDQRVNQVLSLVGDHMPLNSSSPYASYLPGFTALRLMLMKTDKTPRETEVLETILGSYSSYVTSGRAGSEIAWLLARDCMHLCTQAPTAHPAPVQGGALILENGVNNFDPSPLRMQDIQGMAQPGTLQTQRTHQHPLMPTMALHGMEHGMASAPVAPAQQGGQQHGSSNGTL